jgi:hypothetical protein
MRRRLTCTALVTAAASVLSGAVAYAAPTPPKTYTSAIEGYAAYSPQTTCSPTAKPGVVAFKDQVLRTYPWTRSLGIVRACSVGGRSEHKEGRAWDWGVNASSTRDAAAVNDLLKWLFATDRYGNKHAMARRLGIQYVIWNRKIWGAYSAAEGWRTYTGASPHTDHVHISFSWPGARKTTSYWTGKVGSTTAPPTGGGGTDGSTPPMPDDEAVAEPLPPSKLLAGPALSAPELLSVSARNPKGATTVNALQAGQPYLVHVTGTYGYRPGGRADAECSNSPWAPSRWDSSRSVHRDAPDADHLDLYLNGIDGRFEGNTGERCDPVDHTYRWTYVPTRTGRANFRIWDTKFSDNSGGLTVRLYKLATDDSDQSFAVAATAPTGATPKVVYRGGQSYVVQVAGTWKPTGTSTADADCVLTAGSWERRYASGTAFRGVVLNARDEWGRPLVDDGGGCDPATHTYRFFWQPRDDTTLTVKVADATYTNNAGALKVRVVRSDLAGRLPGPPPPPPETLEVDSRRKDGVLTAKPYLDDANYEVVVRGTYDAGAGVTADAECSATTSDPVWRPRRESTLSRHPLWDLMVDGRVLDWQPLTGGSGCSATHEYRTVISPRDDGRLWLGMRDVTFGDNDGSLTVTIRKV